MAFGISRRQKLKSDFGGTNVEKGDRHVRCGYRSFLILAPLILYHFIPKFSTQLSITQLAKEVARAATGS